MRLEASGFEALEGAVLDDDGALLFSDLRGGGVHRLTERGVDVVIPDRTGVGGICLHAGGGLVVSGADLRHVRGDATRVLLSLADLAERPDTSAVAFNDIGADRGGRLFAGVLRQDADGAPVPGELVRVTAERRHEVVHDDLHPNGVGMSPDGTCLYVSDTFGRRVVMFAADDGKAIGAISTAAVDGLPDGLAVDAEGCVWIAFYRGACVVRFSPDGRIVRRLPVPALKPLSVCIAGDASPVLYVVTATREPGSAETGSVYRVPIDVPAAPVDRVSI